MSEGLPTVRQQGDFARRDRFLLVLLWVQIPSLAALGLALEEPVYDVSLISLALIGVALAGTMIARHRLAAAVVSLGLLATSALVIHYAGGAALAHFHFFLMIGAISFYLDGSVLTLAVATVAGYHVAAAAADAGDIMWAATHSGAIAALALLLFIGWRFTQTTPDLDSSGDRFRMSFEAAPIGMAVLKPSGEFIEANRAMGRILGYDARSLAGVNVTGLVHPDDQTELGDAWEEMGNSSGHSATEWMRCLTPDGHPVWGRVSLSLVPRTEDHPALVVMQLEDATRSYEEQRRLETLLEGKDEFVAAVGDEIRQPLGLLIDLTDLAEHSHVDSRDTLPRIEAHAREIASIVDDLVVSARANATAAISHHIDAGALCREVIASLPGGESIELDIEATGVWGDWNLTRQILTNLIGNAVRYGGPSVSVHTFHSGPDTVVQVTDDGPELPAAERDRVFSGDLRNGPPMTRPASVGLSLSVSRHLARLMEGDVVYRRTGDGENIFELRLPSEEITAIPRRRGIMGIVPA
jgi:PAS domain S-box-containing protein